MARALPQAPANSKTRPTISSCMCLLSFIVTVALATSTQLPALAMADSPSTLVLYVHSSNDSSVISTMPPNPVGGTILPFGEIIVVNNILREGKAPDSLQLGYSVGADATGKFSVYFSNAYVLNTTSYAGSITVQGEAMTNTIGEVAITGGTGDFRFARGYVISALVTGVVGQTDLVFQSTFTLKYD